MKDYLVQIIAVPNKLYNFHQEHPLQIILSWCDFSDYSNAFINYTRNFAIKGLTLRNCVPF